MIVCCTIHSCVHSRIPSFLPGKWERLAWEMRTSRTWGWRRGKRHSCWLDCPLSVLSQHQLDQLHRYSWRFASPDPYNLCWFRFVHHTRRRGRMQREHGALAWSRAILSPDRQSWWSFVWTGTRCDKKIEELGRSRVVELPPWTGWGRTQQSLHSQSQPLSLVFRFFVSHYWVQWKQLLCILAWLSEYRIRSKRVLWLDHFPSWFLWKPAQWPHRQDCGHQDTARSIAEDDGEGKKVFRHKLHVLVEIGWIVGQKVRGFCNWVGEWYTRLQSRSVGTVFVTVSVPCMRHWNQCLEERQC